VAPETTARFFYLAVRCRNQSSPCPPSGDGRKPSV